MVQTRVIHGALTILTSEYQVTRKILNLWFIFLVLKPKRITNIYEH